MTPVIWEPLERIASELRWGSMVVELKVSGGQVVYVEVRDKRESWSKKDLERQPVVE